MSDKSVPPAFRPIPLPVGASSALKLSVEHYDILSKAADKLVQYFQAEAEHAQFMEGSTQRQLNLTLQRIALHQTEAQQLQALQKLQDHDSGELADLNKREERTVTTMAPGPGMLEPVEQQVKPGLTREEKEQQARLTEAIGARALEIDRLASLIKEKADAEKVKQPAQSRSTEEARAVADQAADGQRLPQDKAADDQREARIAGLNQKLAEQERAFTDLIAKQKASSDAWAQQGKAAEQFLDIAEPAAKYLRQISDAEALHKARPDLISSAQLDVVKNKLEAQAKPAPPPTKVQADVADASTGQKDATKHYQSVGDGIVGSLARQAAQIGTLGDQMAGVFSAVGDKIRTSLGSAFAEAILKGGTFRRTMTTIGQGIVTSFVQSGAQMVANWLWRHTAMAAVRRLFHVQDVAETAVAEGSKVGLAVAGQTGQTAAQGAGSAARGAIKVGETIFHGIQVGIQTAASIAGEIAQTAITLAQAPLRIASMLAESGVKLVSAALGAMAAMSSIPYVGPFLAIAAMAGIIAAGSKLLHREQGGPVTAGQSYIVGEKRPEVFVPNTDGFIIPSVAQAMTRPGYAPGGRSGGPGGTGRAGGGGQRPVNVYPLMADDRGSIERAQRDPYSDAHFVQMLKKHRRVIGVR
ncbi:MAG: hypothetical protein JSS11_06365 [Verrucomicrobia bacterium]|nr:hypothetical protein [Verrucomicrobiota bacterium]